MGHDEHHVHLLDEVAEIFKPLLLDSPQAIYIYLDDTHKVCNQNFVDLLGYDTVDDWVKNETPLDDVKEDDQKDVVEAYGKASEELIASPLSVSIVKKDGSEVKVDIVMIPFKYKDEVFVIHFISPNK